jgi:hypothetical protein
MPVKPRPFGEVEGSRQACEDLREGLKVEYVLKLKILTLPPN